MKYLKGLTKQFLIIIFYFFISISLELIFFHHLYESNNLINNACYIFINFIILICFIFIFRKKLIPDFYDFKKNFKEKIEKNISYYLIGFYIMLISNIIINFFIGLPTNEALNRNILTELPVYSLFAMIIYAPITEELLTRVYLKNTFNNPYIYIGLSGLIFASLHLLTATTWLEVLFLIPYGALGCAFATIYYKSDNIWTNIFFHAAHNTLAIISILGGLA